MSATIPTPEELGFDPAKIREKYREEREKRLRPEGIKQYRQTKGALDKFNDDPHVAPGFTRQPIVEDLDVLVIGAGFGGILMGSRLREQGVNNFRIVEKAGGFGGVWYWNRYPGAQCDVESYIYMPLLEETGYMPKEKYGYADEIREHAERIARKYDLYDRACFQTQIEDLVWDPDLQRWIVRTDRDDQFRAKFVIMSSGPMSRPQMPGIEGIEEFRGETFHTSRWNYEYTGGNSKGGMHKLHDKTVAVIGTGATGVQCIPMVARDAKKLFVVQRTPAFCGVRGNHPTDPQWAKTLTTGWTRRRTVDFCKLLSGQQPDNLVIDSWTKLFQSFATLLDNGEVQDEGTMAQLAEIADMQNMEEIRDLVEFLVDDPKTAEALKPWYGQWCKRPTFNDDYLATFNRSNVELLDSCRGVERITEDGIVVNGTEHKVDCLIFATGFETATDYSDRARLTIRGRNGLTLSEYWKDGPRTYQGFHTHNFPNMFHLSLLQTGFTLNVVAMLLGQTEHVGWLVAHLLDNEIEAVEAEAEAEARWVDLVKADTPLKQYQRTCTPGYYNGEGAENGTYFADVYPDGILAFQELLANWRAGDAMEGLVVQEHSFAD